jgi:chitodextrinase
MTKKSIIDERIDTLFAGINPEESVNKSERISEIDKNAPHLIDPPTVRRNSNQGALAKSTRQRLILPLGFTTVCLLTAVFVFARFQTASTAPRPNLPAPPGSVQNTPEPTNIKDTQPPSVPSGLTTTTADATSLSLAWAASSDNLGVVGYTIYRNGVSIATTSSSELTFRDTATMPDTAYNYALDAYDRAGNHSAVSASLQVNTPAQPGNLIFLRPEEDTYVSADSPASIYGTANTLRVDASPDIHAYLRFVVTGLDGKKIIRARLLLYTKSGTARGIQVRAVMDKPWNELGTSYNNAPALGDQLALSPAADSDTWIALEVTPYVTGEGRFNFGIVTDSTTAINLASRETEADAPQLVLDLR